MTLNSAIFFHFVFQDQKECNCEWISNIHSFQRNLSSTLVIICERVVFIGQISFSDRTKAHVTYWLPNEVSKWKPKFPCSPDSLYHLCNHKEIGPFWKISYSYCDVYWKTAMNRLHIMLQYQVLFITQSQTLQNFCSFCANWIVSLKVLSFSYSVSSSEVYTYNYKTVARGRSYT